MIEPVIGTDRTVDERLAEVVGRYSRRVARAVLAQHAGASVSSALGVWLLLAACASAADEDDRPALEQALGCSAQEASKLLAGFMASAPPALAAAIAVWVRTTDATNALATWVRGLPEDVESGFMPTQSDADEWARERTLGLIEKFPLTIDHTVRVVLASALATKVSWHRPFDAVAADQHLAPTSPWRGIVTNLLWDGAPAAMLFDTGEAGVVAVHQAPAEEALTVISVSADPGVPREAVFEVAYELGDFARRDEAPEPRSLFELPLGSGHSWEISERETNTHTPGQRVERIAGASLPAWRANGELDLLGSELFGTRAALDVVRKLIGPARLDQLRGRQSAVATFTRYGFEAAAVSAAAIATSARRAPTELGIERTAVLRFDHPYAAIAIAGPPIRRLRSGELRRARLGYSGLPLFTAWIDEPAEAEAQPAPHSNSARR